VCSFSGLLALDSSHPASPAEGDATDSRLAFLFDVAGTAPALH